MHRTIFIKGIRMKKIISILFVFSIVSVISACAEKPTKTGNSAEEQRAHAAKAQRELSTEVGK